MKKRCLGCMEEYEGEFDICPYCGYIYGTPAKEAYHISPGCVLKDRYIVGRVLGSGGFGITYIGFDMKLEQTLAIKEYLPTEFATRMPGQSGVTVYGGEQEEQFHAGMIKTLDEARRLAQFQNEPDILHIYDFFEANQTAYIVMEYLDGETLKDKLARDKTMTVEESLPVMLAVLSALKKVHAAGIVHRDIAPDNIYLLKDGTVKLIDFGASRHATTTHTKSLTVILKFGYAPLEQYQSGGNQGPWTDIYALAATFYKMLTGKKPEEAPERRLKDNLKEPSKLAVAIQKSTENALMNALQVKIEDRTKSAEAFEEELLAGEVVRTEATPNNDPVLKWPLWLKAVIGGASALVLILVIALASGLVGNYKVGTTGSMNLAEDQTRIPNLINMEQDEARKVVEEYGLEYEVGNSETSEKIKEGRILGQMADGQKVSAGATVKRGTVLSVTISSGKGSASIPNVVWMTKELAVEHLKNNRLIAVNYAEDPDTFAAAGTVTGIEPEAGSNVELKQNITLKIATGENSQADKEKTADIPDLSGKTEQEAYEVLQGNGLYIEKTAIQYSDSVALGCIITQTPTGGMTGAHHGDTVTVIVSGGKEMIEVPYLQNEARENAEAVVAGLGLISDVQHVFDDNVQAGNVVRQDVEAGKMVEKGTVITFYISDGQAPAQTQPQQTVTQTRAVNQTQAPAPPQTQAPPQTPAPETAPPPVETPAPTHVPETAADDIWSIIGD